MAVLDPYATAKANLRDNVKTLMAVFAAIAGVLVAGTPFSGFGSLPIGPRFFAAVAALIGAVVFVGWAMRVLIDVLRPDLVYRGMLHDGFDPETVVDRRERAELVALRLEFDARRAQLMPGKPGDAGYIESIEVLESTLITLWNTAKASAAARDPGAPQDLAFWGFYDDALAGIVHWAGFTRLHWRVTSGIRRGFALGFVALLCIGVFAWAASPPKPAAAEAAGSTVVIEERVRPPEPASSVPRFEPVLFETGKTGLSRAAVERIAKARDHLRQHADAALVVFAYTDTRGGNAVNVRLARDRAKAVVDALKAGGGIAGSRIFSAELAQTDLPVLTAPQVDNAENRSVWMAVVPAPPR